MMVRKGVPAQKSPELRACACNIVPWETIKKTNGAYLAGVADPVRLSATAKHSNHVVHVVEHVGDFAE